MTTDRSDHWLWRLDAEAWLAAAHTELEQGRGRVDSRRTAVTHARRAAGMALNAVLVCLPGQGWPTERCETAWGRSYIDHLRALATAVEDEAARAPFDRELCLRCAELLSISVMPPTGLVSLSRRRDEAAHGALELGAQIVRACSEFAQTHQSA